ncbi:MAG TPA: hypothetical protein VFR01_00245, partial [Geobacterales bacterium]|nr:hypothetical protein [Geobacterales bacterium]
MAFVASIRSKVWLCVLVALVGYLVATISGLISNHRIGRHLEHQRSFHLPLVIEGIELVNSYKKQVRFYEDAFVLAEPESAEKGGSLFAEISGRFDRMMTVSANDDPVMFRRISLLRRTYEEYFRDASRIYVRLACGDNKVASQEEIRRLGARQSTLQQELENLSAEF